MVLEQIHKTWKSGGDRWKIQSRTKEVDTFEGLKPNLKKIGQCQMHWWNWGEQELTDPEKSQKKYILSMNPYLTKKMILNIL
jgi:hypothetical protein